MSEITIFHNPACGTSRKVLAALRAAGHEPEVIEYLKTGWTRPQLEGLLAAMGVGPRALLREKEAAAPGPEASEAEILDAMLAHPVLVNRPIVVAPGGTALVRPAERLQDLLGA